MVDIGGNKCTLLSSLLYLQLLLVYVNTLYKTIKCENKKEMRQKTSEISSKNKS